MFNDLLLYELVLLCLGVLLFLVLIIAFLFYMIKNQPIKKLLLFFPFPIIMIGYPSIQGIEIASDRIKLVKNQEELMNDPTDSVARKKTIEYSKKIEKRAKTSQDLVTVSKSNLILGNSEKAISYANKALEINKNDKNALALKKLAQYNEALQKKDSSYLKQNRVPAVTPELISVKKYIRQNNLAIKQKKVTNEKNQ